MDDYIENFEKVKRQELKDDDGNVKVLQNVSCSSLRIEKFAYGESKSKVHR